MNGQAPLKSAFASMAAILVFLASVAFAPQAQAQTVSECDWRARADAIVEPWDVFSRTYASGDVRLALLDTIEPGVGALHLLLLFPGNEEIFFRECRVVSLNESTGFAGILFEDHLASYDPSIGLIFEMDVQVFDQDTGGFEPRILIVTLNRSSNTVIADLL